MGETLFLSVLYTVIGTTAFADEPMVLWCRQPAQVWEAAYPLGNGRLGAMVFGTVRKEHLQLNEESLWAGEPFDVYPDHFTENLKTIQQLVLDGKFIKAQQFGLEKMTKSPTSFRSYEPLADLWIEMDHGPSVQSYRRQLDLQTGIASIEYIADGILFKREVLISAMDDVLAVRLWADKPGAISAKVRLTRQKDMQVSAVGSDRLQMDGQIIDIPAPEGYDDNPGGSGPGGEHMRFAGRLLARAKSGVIETKKDRLVIQGASEVVLLFTGATDFNLDKMNFDRNIDPAVVADRILDKVSQKSWDDISRDHVKEHRTLFDRVSIELGNSKQDKLPTDERLTAFKQGVDDPGLIELSFQLGRYLLMSSSRRPGRLPANLQGIWNAALWAPWESDYHFNINLQMNYWPADLCNLSETMDSFTDWFENVTEKGRVSAEKLYGARGWVAFTAVDLFGRTTPGGSTLKSQYQNGVLDPLAGAWTAMTLWRHFEFTQDKSFLRSRAYPILKGASEFLLDLLIEDKNGNLIIVPSTSPENSYIHPETRQPVRITKGSTYHNILVRAVFEATIQGANTLGIDDDLSKQLEHALKKIPLLKVGANGTIQEWVEDYEEWEPGHRHMSPLLGLHPFAQITPRTPELFEAASKTIERRLSHHASLPVPLPGWSKGWLINFYARLLDSEMAYRRVLAFLCRQTHPNLIEHDPEPFHVDAFLSTTAGIAEMLLQSHAGEIHLLPALPKAWPAGHIHGLKARGGFVVDIDWKDGKRVTSRIRSEAGRVCRVRCNAPHTVTSQGQVVNIRVPETRVSEFDTDAGEVYKLNAQ